MKDLRKFISTTIKEYMNENYFDEKFAYHVTRRKNLPSIKKKGLELCFPIL